MFLSTLRMAAAAAVLAVTAGAAGAAFILSPVPNPIPKEAHGTWSVRSTLHSDGSGSRRCRTSCFSPRPALRRERTLTYSANLSQIGYSAQTGGVALGANSLSTDDFEVFIGGGFNPFSNFLGTFPETFVSATFTGDVGGNAVVDELDPSRASLGFVTISAAPGGGFFIDNRAAIFGVYTINGGDPITVPVALTVGAPEPSIWTMMALGFAGLGFAGYRASRKTASVAA